MKKVSYIIIILMLTSVIFSENVQAQAVRQVFIDFKKLERYLLRVADLVRNFQNDRAGKLILDAKIEFEKAKDLLYNSPPITAAKIKQARIHMLIAKEKADIAARIVLRKPLGNLKSQLDDLINQAENKVSQTPSDEAYYLLNQAKKFRRLAINAFESSKVDRMQEYIRISFFFARKCVDFSSGSSDNLYMHLTDLQNSIKQLISQLENIIDDSNRPGLQKIVEEAQSHFDEAQRLLEEGKTLGRSPHFR